MLNDLQNTPPLLSKISGHNFRRVKWSGPELPKAHLSFLEGVLKVISTYLASKTIFMLDCAWGKQVALSLRDASSF